MERGGTLEAKARSLGRVAAHAFVGWLLSTGTMEAVLLLSNRTTATFIHGFAAPAVFVGVSASYFGRANAWAPLRAAIAFAVIVALLDLAVVAGLLEHSLTVFRSVAGTWLPLVLVFLATWTTGLVSAGTGRPQLSARRHGAS